MLNPLVLIFYLFDYFAELIRGEINASHSEINIGNCQTTNFYDLLYLIFCLV